MVLVVLLVTVWVAGGQGAAPTGAGTGGTDATRLGPRPGEDVAAYLSRTRIVVGGAGPRLALVALDAPATPAAVGPAVGPGVTALQAVFRVPLPRVQTALRREDVLTSDTTPDAASAVAAAQLRAAGDARADAATAPPGRARDVAAVETARLSGPCDCVVALVVRGDTAALAGLAAEPAVRAVEVAAPGASTARSGEPTSTA